VARDVYARELTQQLALLQIPDNLIEHLPFWVDHLRIRNGTAWKTPSTTMSEKNLVIASYNCRGLNNNTWHFLENVMEKCNVLCVQEHWLYEKDLSRLNGPNRYSFTGCSSMDATTFSLGRPFGVIEIIWKSNPSYEILSQKTFWNSSVQWKFISKYPDFSFTWFPFTLLAALRSKRNERKCFLWCAQRFDELRTYFRRAVCYYGGF